MRRGTRIEVAARRRCDQISLPIATAVSAMRLEKPHSLSYHAITRTSVPFITLVWSMWNVAECGSWLKSIETFGIVGVGEDALELLLGRRASWRR